jgi:hypothetical protein
MIDAEVWRPLMRESFARQVPATCSRAWWTLQLPFEAYRAAPPRGSDVNSSKLLDIDFPLYIQRLILVCRTSALKSYTVTMADLNLQEIHDFMIEVAKKAADRITSATPTTDSSGSKKNCTSRCRCFLHIPRKPLA